MVLRLSAAAIQHELASRTPLELIESAAAAPGECSPPAHDACPPDDDLLDFCHGRSSAALAVVIQHHLDVCPACMDIATLALNDWEAPEPTEWLAVASNFHPGDCIDDRYRIVRFLASGGMGEVYEAIDTHSGGRVALKALLAAASDSREMLRCFRHEARLARRVRDPHVCHVHGAPAEGDVVARPLVPYFTMEIIDGETLQQRLHSGPLPLDVAIAIARQLLLGIQAIHRAGVLHLDIKSNNVMLREGPALDAVILDFGLARRSEPCRSRGRVRPLTGSLPFISPEQILGLTPGVQNDIFAFGVVLFQMLTGVLPYASAKGAPGSSIAERLTAKAPAPSQIAGALPEWLDELVRRCLAERDERFRSVDEVLEALDATVARSL